MELLDSRRLTGPGLLLDREGAAIEVSYGAGEENVVSLWRERVRRLLNAVGWGTETVAVRLFPGGASLAITAPFDALFAACDVAEAAWTAATAAQAGEAEPDSSNVVEALRAAIEAERDPQLVALRDGALANGVTFLIDDRAVTVGLGTGSRTFERPERSEPSQPSPPAPLPQGEGRTPMSLCFALRSP